MKNLIEKPANMRFESNDEAIRMMRLNHDILFEDEDAGYFMYDKYDVVDNEIISRDIIVCDKFNDILSMIISETKNMIVEFVTKDSIYTLLRSPDRAYFPLDNKRIYYKIGKKGKNRYHFIDKFAVEIAETAATVSIRFMVKDR